MPFTVLKNIAVENFWDLLFVNYVLDDTLTFNDPFSGTTWVSRYQKGKPIWISLKWVAVASAGAYASLHLAKKFFTGWMPLLPAKQHRQST